MLLFLTTTLALSHAIRCREVPGFFAWKDKNLYFQRGSIIDKNVTEKEKKKRKKNNFKLIILYQNVWIANFNNNNIDRIISRGRTATKEILLTVK